MSTLSDYLAAFETRAKGMLSAVYDPESRPTYEQMIVREASFARQHLVDIGELTGMVRKAQRRIAEVEDLLRQVSMNPKGGEHGSGRTTRMLLRGLIALSEGKPVLIAAPISAHAKNLAKRLEWMARQLGVPCEKGLVRSGSTSTERIGFRGVTLVDNAVFGDEE